MAEWLARHLFLLLCSSAALIYFIGRDAALSHAVTYVLLPVIFIAFALLQKPEATDDGATWRRLNPSHMYMATFVFASVLTGLFLYVYLFVGSARADAEQQMMYLLALIVAFGAGSIVMFVHCFIQKTRWNNERIENWLGPYRLSFVNWNDIVSVDLNGLSGSIRITDSCGKALSFNPEFDGAAELLQTMEKLQVLRDQASPSHRP